MSQRGYQIAQAIRGDEPGRIGKFMILPLAGEDFRKPYMRKPPRFPWAAWTPGSAAGEANGVSAAVP